MAEPLAVSGLLSAKDVKRLTSLTRGSMIGPTALYYGGTTAPIISAAVATLVRSALQRTELQSEFVHLFSTIVAAMAGISWYLIFMRWSYRPKHGRGTELSETTELVAGETHLSVRRSGIETNILWENVERVQRSGPATALIVKGTDAVLIPDAWFDGNEKLKTAFLQHLNSKARS